MGLMLPKQGVDMAQKTTVMLFILMMSSLQAGGPVLPWDLLLKVIEKGDVKDFAWLVPDQIPVDAVNADRKTIDVLLREHISKELSDQRRREIGAMQGYLDKQLADVWRKGRLKKGIEVGDLKAVRAALDAGTQVTAEDIGRARRLSPATRYKEVIALLQ
jgi:hypothetical protein